MNSTYRHRRMSESEREERRTAERERVNEAAEQLLSPEGGGSVCNFAETRQFVVVVTGREPDSRPLPSSLQWSKLRASLTLKIHLPCF